jgi:hypothetical protein
LLLARASTPTALASPACIHVSVGGSGGLFSVDGGGGSVSGFWVLMVVGVVVVVAAATTAVMMVMKLEQVVWMLQRLW